ncbi:anaerobic sulfatase maturase [Photobacterium sanctipauli]|uniref:Anaerobic sulfatase maturase n=1 Tax=Photobacterium sanctipauli TaxID=1342794 RepID=A0A2T3NPG7_9GAMM|nr:anaerobic sulfatase maturase [Photobacterium sanctipauli]PSW18112.1 anaerobic sulfatase maturase [Photobacterium sanctipauli]
MAKPTSFECNLSCDYCFYLEKEKYYNKKKQAVAMNDEVLRQYIKQYIQSQDTDSINFAWQGGEPTMAGLAFYEKAIKYQKQFANGKNISNSIQTNGILFNQKWADFLAENQFLVGLSIDGPEALHNKYRVTNSGKGTFDKVIKSLELLQKNKVEYNTLTVVNSVNQEHPLEVYRFLKEIGSAYQQYIPIVETRHNIFSDPSLITACDPEGNHLLPWSVDGLSYGKFMTTIFDEWVRNDIGQVFIQLFDTTLGSWAGYQPGLCIFQEECGSAMVIERNGDLYSCDHYVYPEFKLGNVLDKNMSKLAQSKQQVKFGKAKKSKIAKECLECEFRFACNGGCPKHRISLQANGDRQNHLCEGYKHFFSQTKPYMLAMVNELRQRRSPANVMAYADAIAAQSK